MTVSELLERKDKCIKGIEEATKTIEKNKTEIEYIDHKLNIYKNNNSDVASAYSLLTSKVKVDIVTWWSGYRTYDVKELQLIRTPLIRFLESLKKGDITTITKQYYGVKTYDRWTQESNHPYGYGPSHGSIIARIGKGEKPLKDEDILPLIDACELLLRNLDIFIEMYKKPNEKYSKGYEVVDAT